VGKMADILIDRIIELRNRNGLSQKAVADAIAVQHVAYQRYEYGMREPKLSSIKALAQFYNVSTDYLLGLDDIPNRKDSGK